MEPMEWLKDNAYTILFFFIGIFIGVLVYFLWANYIYKMISPSPIIPPSPISSPYIPIDPLPTNVIPR